MLRYIDVSVRRRASVYRRRVSHTAMPWKGCSLSKFANKRRDGNWTLYLSDNVFRDEDRFVKCYKILSSSESRDSRANHRGYDRGGAFRSTVFESIFIHVFFVLENDTCMKTRCCIALHSPSDLGKRDEGQYYVLC